MQTILRSLKKLIVYIDRQQYCGYDPYDALNSALIRNLPGKWSKIAATQMLKRMPFNIRPAIGINPSVNPKAMGLCLHAWSIMYKCTGEEEYKRRADYCFRWLMENYSKGFSGLCWGYDFPWISPIKYLEACSPTSVVTGFVVRGLHAYGRIFDKSAAAEAIISAASFVMKDLHITETPHGLCFSYSVKQPECCYNASLMAAEILCRAYDQMQDASVKATAARAFDYVVHKQKANGQWNYSIDEQNGKERRQVDFHQGFILDSLAAFIELTEPTVNTYRKALIKGLSFYCEHQFAPDGRAYWRLPARYPADIHHQAQGIITLSSLNNYLPGMQFFARTIAHWTIEHMQHRKGFFYFRKYRLFTNRIAYMRWSQAWMLLALARLIESER